MDQHISELSKRKEVLNGLYEEFNRLKSEEKWEEAWKQLIKTLQYANETLKLSAEILRKTLLSQSDECIDDLEDKSKPLMKEEVPAENRFEKKMIVIPKVQNIH